MEHWARRARQGQSGVLVTLGHWQQLLETSSLAKAMTFCNGSSTKKALGRNLSVSVEPFFQLTSQWLCILRTLSLQAVGSQPSCQPWRAWLLPQWSGTGSHRVAGR